MLWLALTGATSVGPKPEGISAPASGPAVEERAARKANQDERNNRWSGISPRGALKKIEPPTSEACEKNPDCREQEDLRAQQSVALSTAAILDYTRLQLGLAVFGTGLVFWGLLLNARATRAANEAAKAASEQARIAQMALDELERPYVFCRSLTVRADFFSTEEQRATSSLDVSVAVFFENLGRAPAILTSLQLHLRVSVGAIVMIDADRAIDLDSSTLVADPNGFDRREATWSRGYTLDEAIVLFHERHNWQSVVTGFLVYELPGARRSYRRYFQYTATGRQDAHRTGGHNRNYEVPVVAPLAVIPRLPLLQRLIKALEE